MQINFVTVKDYEKWADINQLEPSHIAKFQSRIRSGVDAWIAQTYLYLKGPLAQRGVACEFTNQFQPGVLSVAHRDDLNSYAAGIYRSYVAGVRADRPPLYACDSCIVQNNVFPPNTRQAYIPHWSQPGLVPRNPARGTRIQKVAYFGRDSSAPDWFRDDEFHAALRLQGVTFSINTQEWHDYSDTDLVIACRTDPLQALRLKPATKLTNAWLAGVPALVGPEPAYQALRKSGLDAIEIHSAKDVLDAIRSLVDDPERYRAMIANANIRSEEFSVDSISIRWMSFLLDEMGTGYTQWSAAMHSRAYRNLRSLRYTASLSAQKVAAKLHRRGWYAG